MFTNTNVLKRIITDAWKTQNLHVGHIDGKYYITGEYWSLEVKDTKITNKLKAILIELIGDLPKEGIYMLYGKDMDPQYELVELAYFDWDKIDTYALLEYGVSPVFIIRDNVMQAVLQNHNGETKLINSIYLSMISNQYIDEDDGETPVEGPLEFKKMVLWHNNVMSFMCYTRDAKYVKERNILKALSDMDIVYSDEYTETIEYAEKEACK